MARTNLTVVPKRDAAERQAQDAEAILNERIEASSSFRSAGIPPDWLTTGLAGAGAGWVFGPVGGVIGAAVNAIVSKRRREGIIQRATTDAKDGQALIDAGEKSVALLEQNAKTEQDRFEAALVRQRYNKAATAAKSANPETAQAGFAGLFAIDGIIEGEADEVEQALIAREQVARDQFQTEIGRADGIRDDVQREAGDFAVRQDAYERMLAVDDTAAGDQVLLVNSFKMVDPTSAVLTNEAATAANTAGVPDILTTAYNRILRNGERLEPEQRADIIRQAGLQYAVARADQVDRNTAAMQRGRDQKVRDSLLNQIAFPVKDSDALPFPALPTSDATVDQALREPQAATQPAEPGAEVSALAGLQDEPTGNNLTNAFSMFGSPDVRGMRVLPQGVQARVDQLPDSAKVFVDRDSGDLIISDRGSSSRRMNLDQTARNSILGTVPSNDELQNMGTEAEAESPGFFSEEASAARRAESERRMRENPGLFQPGGVFGGPAREVNE